MAHTGLARERQAVMWFLCDGRTSWNAWTGCIGFEHTMIMGMTTALILLFLIFRKVSMSVELLRGKK
jgi:hypothetical protein